MNRRSFAIVIVTVVTVDESLTQLLEPEAPPVAQRIKTIAQLKQAGITSGFALLPIIPLLTDSEEHVAHTLEAMAPADPDFVVWGPLWMPNDRHRERIQSLVQESVSEIASAYHELYETNPSPHESYQRSLDRSVLMVCQRLGLEPRIPPQVYVNHLPEEMTSALLRRRQQFIERAGCVNI
jgi:DNA repair photolyase